MRLLRGVLIILLFAGALGYSAMAGGFQRGGLGETRIVAGLREALEVGVGNAVNVTGRLDGFFRNAAIKILLPRELQTLGKTLRAVGQGRLVDEFVLSMNRAAERAAPQARRIFVGAIREMSFDDARRILSGGDTAATDYFRRKTEDELADAFHPIVEKAMDEVGATRQYKELTGRLRDLPFGRSQSLDIDDYVVGKALDGLFYIVGEEEKKIRRNPAARVTEILRDVFGGLGGRGR
jgi:hypothetical protein